MVGKERREGGCPGGVVELGGCGDKSQNLEGRSRTWEARFPNIYDGAFVKRGIVHVKVPKCIRVPSVEGSSCDRAEGVGEGRIRSPFDSHPTWKKTDRQLLESSVSR